MRVDAVVLVKSSARQMKDVWGMIKAAYREKAKAQKDEWRQSERAKVVKEGKEKVEEGIRSKKEAMEETTRTAAMAMAVEKAVEVAVEVERRKAGDGGSEGKDGNSSVGGGVGGGELD
jgi:hypothetical protein